MGQRLPERLQLTSMAVGELDTATAVRWAGNCESGWPRLTFLPVLGGVEAVLPWCVPRETCTIAASVKQSPRTKTRLPKNAAQPPGAPLALDFRAYPQGRQPARPACRKQERVNKNSSAARTAAARPRNDDGQRGADVRPSRSCLRFCSSLCIAGERGGLLQSDVHIVGGPVFWFAAREALGAGTAMCRSVLDQGREVFIRVAVFSRYGQSLSIIVNNPSWKKSRRV